MTRQLWVKDDSCEQAAPQKQTRSYLIWINKIIYILTFSPSLLISFSRSLPFSLSQSCIRIDTQLFISCISLSLLRTYRHTNIYCIYILFVLFSASLKHFATSLQSSIRSVILSCVTDRKFAKVLSHLDIYRYSSFA